jgi:RNA polymerase sigma-70 factor, ECF subfamily
MTPDEATTIVDRLFETWYATLVRYAMRWTATSASAEDLVQDAFMQLYRALRDGKAIDNPRAWTLVVLRRAIGRQYREWKRHGGDWQPIEEAEAFGLLPAVPPPGDLEAGDLARLLARLTPREEEVVLLRLDALKYREIASHLGISASSVNTLLARALRKIARMLRRDPAPAARAIERDKVDGTVGIEGDVGIDVEEKDDTRDVPDTLH